MGFPNQCRSMWNGYRCERPAGHPVSRFSELMEHVHTARNGMTCWVDEPESQRAWLRRSSNDIEQAAADAEVEPDEQPPSLRLIIDDPGAQELTGDEARAALERWFSTVLIKRGIR